MQPIATKLPKVGTTIFTVMSQLALEHRAVNLGQGFPDFPVPEALVDALAKAMRDGRNQYAPMMSARCSTPPSSATRPRATRPRRMREWSSSPAI